MSTNIQVRVPDIGDFKGVAVIEIQVAPGDQVEKKASLITLETDKTTMEIPSPEAGRVTELKVEVGSKVSGGDPILTLEVEKDDLAAQSLLEVRPPPKQERPAPLPSAESTTYLSTQVVVLGAGPGGYTAAFRAADLGKQVVLVERYDRLGGVCLNVGCIPSKALLHAAQTINEAAEIANMGVHFGAPEINLAQLRAGKDRVVERLTVGLAALARQRKVRVVQGTGRFETPNRITVATREGQVPIDFDQAIIACGSKPIKIPGLPHADPRVIDSTGALELTDIPERMLIVGGGIIGLEMATIYQALGTRIEVVELLEQLLPGCDKDLVRPLEKIIKRRYNSIMLGTKVTVMNPVSDGIRVDFEGKQAPPTQVYDRVLVTVGRHPNGKLIAAEKAGVKVDERGFIPVDVHMRTNVPNIFAIGDVVGNPMLAHKATHEAKVAAEVIAGLPPALSDPLTVPSVAYTDPEVAWMGLTETAAKAQGVAYEKGSFPWAASGRALGIGRDEGMTKLLFDPQTKRILGAGIVGPNAGELIGETVLALEMGADYEDIGLTVHPHPTLNETICFAAEMAHGSITDLMPPRKRY